MKKIFFLFCMMISIQGFTQWPGNYYVAARGGLSLREKQDINSKALATIPYGTKISVSYLDEAVFITAEGMEGSWANVTYNGKKGYVVNVYLLPWPPPKETVKTMKQYLPQVSAVAGLPLVKKSSNIESLESGGSNMKKQMFKNGAEYHEESFYESNNDAYFLPGFTLQQGFVLVRLLPEFKKVFEAGAVFPQEDVTTKRGESEYIIKVVKEKMGEFNRVEKIKVEYEEGAFYTFEMFILGGQLVISFGGGV